MQSQPPFSFYFGRAIGADGTVDSVLSLCRDIPYDYTRSMTPAAEVRSIARRESVGQRVSALYHLCFVGGLYLPTI